MVAKAKMKRVFTHEMNVAIDGVDGENTEVLCAAEFVAQEDIHIIGVDMDVQNRVMQSQNDGMGENWAELSQSGRRYGDGILIQGGAWAWWNTTPASVGCTQCNHILMFPEGSAIPLREEGRLYLHTCSYNLGISAGVTSGSVHVIIYYTKD